MLEQGQKVGRWTLLRHGKTTEKNGNKHDAWFCKCDCGTEKWVKTDGLKNGRSKSCGCLKKELAKERCTTHGRSKTKEYKSYKSMMDRCYNERHDNYRNYGGRNGRPIRVCERWHTIENFLDDAVQLPGYTPGLNGLTLDRIDPDGDYSPENCRWADNLTQQNNRRDNTHIIYNGEDVTLANLARKENISYASFVHTYLWNKDALSIDEIVNKVKSNRPYNIAEIARENNVPYAKLYHQHVTRHLPINEAIAKIKNTPIHN